MSIDVRNLKYEIANSIGKESTYMIVTAKARDSEAKREYLSTIPDIEIGDFITVNSDGTEMNVKVTAVNHVEKSALRQSPEQYATVLRKIDNSNKVLNDFKSVRERLASDQEIENELGKLEDKITKVLKKADELTFDDDGKETKLVRNLYEEYIPKTIAVLEQYSDINNSGLPNTSVQKLREDALSAIIKSNEVYTNVLISLYENDVIELSAEIDALKAMFARGGLLDSDFNISE